MADYIDIYASNDDGYNPQGFFMGNPAGSALLTDDSNSDPGIPDDWTSEPQLVATKRGAFVVIVTNIECDVALCGPAEAPSSVTFVRVRVPTGGGVAQYAVLTEGGRSRVFVRRSV